MGQHKLPNSCCISHYLLYFTFSNCTAEPFNIDYTVYSAQCTVHSVQCTVYSVQCTVYDVQYRVYSLKCTGYSVQYTVYCVKCTVYNVHCTVYSVQSTEYILQNTVYSVQYKVLSVYCRDVQFALQRCAVCPHSWLPAGPGALLAGCCLASSSDLIHLTRNRRKYFGVPLLVKQVTVKTVIRPSH